MTSSDPRGLSPDAKVETMRFGPLRNERAASTPRSDFTRYLDVALELTVEVGSTQATLDEVLDLVPGTVMRLDKRAGDPVDLRVNGKLVARGEVVKVDDCYGVRITSIVDARERAGTAIR